MDFRPITLEQKPLFAEFLTYFHPGASEFVFSNLFAWQPIFDTQYALIDDYLCIILQHDSVYSATLPLINGINESISANIIEKIRIYFEDVLKQALRFTIVTQAHIDLLDDTVVINEQIDNRDNFDYVYLREKLTTLSGRKLQSKRNHVARFKRDFETYEYFAITSQFIDEFRDEIKALTERIPTEQQAIYRLLMHVDELSITGAYITVDNDLVAFTIGEIISENTAVIHIEKANIEFQAAYQIINQSFVEHALKYVEFINREQDLGIEGLRKTKLSYYPDHFVEKFDIIL